MGLTHEVEDPVRSGAQRSTFRPHAKRINLRRIQPWDTLPANTKKDVVEEEEHDRCSCVQDARCVRQRGVHVTADHDGNNQVAEALAGGRVHHHFTPAPPLHVWDADGREERVRN